MFPSGMFAKSYFAGTYFPPVINVLPPPEPPIHYGGGRQRWRRTEDVVRQWRIEQDDEELLFLIE